MISIDRVARADLPGRKGCLRLQNSFELDGRVLERSLQGLFYPTTIESCDLLVGLDTFLIVMLGCPQGLVTSRVRQLGLIVLVPKVVRLLDTLNFSWLLLKYPVPSGACTRHHCLVMLVVV